MTRFGLPRISIDDMLSRRDVSMEGEHRAVLEAYRMFAHDRGWVRKLEEAIRNGLTCEAAVEKVQSDTRARMIHMTDSYLRERLHDFDDLANRLLRQLTGFVPGGKGLPQDAIIVARAMGAAELLDYPRAAIRGLVLEDGAVTSHVVIVARAMGIPVVGQVPGALPRWRKTAIRSLSMARMAPFICARWPMSRMPMPTR
jgi:phosphotransferase system enzyme I (PtsP)